MALLNNTVETFISDIADQYGFIISDMTDQYGFIKQYCWNIILLTYFYCNHYLFVH
jgi:hypothetical protein